MRSSGGDAGHAYLTLFGTVFGHCPVWIARPDFANEALRIGAFPGIFGQRMMGAFTMRSIGFTGIALFALSASMPALAQTDSRIGAPPVVVTPPRTTMPTMQTPPITTRPMGTLPMTTRPLGTGQMNTGRMGAGQMGTRPPVAMGHSGMGGNVRYIAPSYGYQLPQQWMTSNYFIADYRSFGLARPAAGFGWSRYYDDAVLTDQWGRVYDWRDDVNWDGGDWNRGDRDDGGRNGRRSDGVVGAVAGAVVGGIAGNVIAGRGNRTAGTLIGSGVGALAGLAIDRESSRRRRSRDDDRYDDRYGDRGGYQRGGSWSHWGSGGSWVSGGGYGAETTVTTVVIHPAPAVAMRTVTYDEYVSVPAKRHPRKYRHRAKGCACGS